MPIKIAVYAIAKNEQKHVERWFNSVQEADGIFVVDTGSEDGTLPILSTIQRLNPKLRVFTARFDPFRFDAARNFILNQIPSEYQYAMFVDLDETLERGWYEGIMRVLRKEIDATAVNLRMVFDQGADGGDKTTYNRLMVHLTKAYRWKYPAHEILVPVSGTDERAVFSDIKVYHGPDLSKPRDYLPLLELSAREYPDDPRPYQYLAREYMYRERYVDAIGAFERHLDLEQHPWLRSESYTLLAYCYEQRGDTLEARDLHTSACAEAPDIRESWAAASSFYFRQERYHSAIGCVENMFDVQEAPEHTIIRNDSYYREWPFHMLATCCHRLGDQKRATAAIRQAVKLAPKNPAVVADMISICDIPVSIGEEDGRP